MRHKLFRHSVSKNLYRLVGVAFLERDVSKCVLYTDHPGNKRIWIRPYNEFFDGRFEEAGEWDDASFDPLGDIKEFHNKFDIAYDGPPRALPQDLGDFRRKFMNEELSEYVAAQLMAWVEHTKTIPDEGNYNFQLERALDGLVDLAYVLFGTAHLHGFDFAEAWNRVHGANMKKIRAKADGSNSTRKSSYDVVKPEGWEAPSLTDLVEINDLTSE